MRAYPWGAHRTGCFFDEAGRSRNNQPVQAQEFSVLGPLMGGFGSQAFLACVHQDDGTIKPTVLVFLPEEAVENPDILGRVFAETEIASRIDHVNVIGVFGLARLEEGFARVVEYADAESLRSVYRRALTLKRPIPPPIATAIVADACMGAHYAHELGEMEAGAPMIHGGLRPETLLVSFQGMAKVTGYGATTLAESLRKTLGRDSSMRDAYTAPEQSYGGRHAVTVHTDVYSLGTVLYEALAGKAPFAADTDLAEAMFREELHRQAAAGVTDAMAAVVLRATRRKSSERYESALEMRHELLENCAVATEAEVRSFMDELFPPGTVPRATRLAMLKGAAEAPPKKSGRLLAELPRETTEPRGRRPPRARTVEVVLAADDPEREREREPLPDATPIRGSRGTRGIEEPTVLPHAVHLHWQADDDFIASRTAAEAGAFDVHSAPTVAAPRFDPYNAGPPAYRPQRQEVLLQQSAPPSWQAPPTTPPLQIAPGSVSFPPQSRRFEEHGAPTPYPQAPAVPTVVYRSPPSLLIGFGLAGGLAVALLGVMLTRDKPQRPRIEPAPIVVQVPVPAEAAPAPVPTAPTVAATPQAVPSRSTPTGPGALVVKTDPASLEIFIDGTSVGRGPVTTSHAPGVVKVRARDKATGIDLSRTVKLGAGRTESVSLVAAKGSISIEAPAGCVVYVDDKRVGTIPMGDIELYEGTHRVSVRKGAIDYKHVVPVKAGTQSFLQVTFHD